MRSSWCLVYCSPAGRRPAWPVGSDFGATVGRRRRYAHRGKRAYNGSCRRASFQRRNGFAFFLAAGSVNLWLRRLGAGRLAFEDLSRYRRGGGTWRWPRVKLPTADKAAVNFLDFAQINGNMLSFQELPERLAHRPR